MCWNVAWCYDSECAKDVGMMPRLINTTLFLQAKFISWLWSRQGFGITTFLRFSCLIQLNPLTLLPMPPIYITHGYSVWIPASFCWRYKNSGLSREKVLGYNASAHPSQNNRAFYSSTGLSRWEVYFSLPSACKNFKKKSFRMQIFFPT